jgi:hypothetical protein
MIASMDASAVAALHYEVSVNQMRNDMEDLTLPLSLTPWLREP